VAGERLTADDVELRATRHQDYALAEEGGWAVALDLTLDDDLRAEGLARELVRGLNDLRKEVGLAIADRVSLTVSADDEAWRAVERHRDYVMGEVLATSLTRLEQGEPGPHTVEADGHTLAVSVERA
jgi:isoleucyl-tRNA synthetase